MTMETTTKASFDSCVKNDDEIVVAYCGPVAEIVAQKLVDLLFVSSLSSSSRTSSQRRICPLKLGEIVKEEEEDKEEEEENEDDDAMTTTTTTTPTTPRVVVIVVETVENDEIAKEGLEVVKILLNALKKIKKTKKIKKRRKYVLVGVGDSRFLANRQYFRSNQNSAEDCNAAARVLDALLEKSERWERVGKRLELDYGREFEGKLERWVTRLAARDDFPPLLVD